MEALFIASCIVFFLYGWLIALYCYGFVKSPSLDIPPNYSSNTPLSILIPIRLHAGQHSDLDKLIASIEEQSNRSQTIEIIIIDDFSSISIECKLPILNLKDYNKALKSSKNNKKEALELGVHLAQHEYIACLDMDVELSKNWLQGIRYVIDTFQPNFAGGIHRYIETKGFFNKFLVTEQDNLTAISIGSLHLGFPTMCNGANMLFSKTAFDKVGGYRGLCHIEGGDDMLLYHRMFLDNRAKTFFVKSLKMGVRSQSAQSLKNFVKQRNRWVSKSMDYELKTVILQLFIVFLCNVLFVGTVFMAFIDRNFLFLVAFKFMVDLTFLQIQKPYFQNPSSMFSLAIMTFCYPFYVLFIGLVALVDTIKTKFIPLSSQ